MDCMVPHPAVSNTPPLKDRRPSNHNDKRSSTYNDKRSSIAHNDNNKRSSTYNEKRSSTHNDSQFSSFDGLGSFVTRYYVPGNPALNQNTLEHNPPEDWEYGEDQDLATSASDDGYSSSDTETTYIPSAHHGSMSTPSGPKSSRSEAWNRVKQMFQKSNPSDFQHHVHLSVHGRLHHAPLHISPPKRALDLGTGRGTWAIEFADLYPNCHVFATDMQSFDDWGMMNRARKDKAKPKVTFTITKPGESWRFKDKFDFIHCRYLSFAADHNTLFRRVFENLNPGGWAEFHEWLIFVRSANGFSKGRGDMVRKWNDLAMEGARKQKKDICIGLKFKSMLKAQGFDNVTQIKYDVPLNSWVPDPKLKRLGEMTLRTMHIALRPFTMSTIGSGLGYSTEQVDEMLLNVVKDTANPDLHAYISMTTTFCQKPDPTSATQRKNRGVSVTPGEYCDVPDLAPHIPIWSED